MLKYEITHLMEPVHHVRALSHVFLLQSLPDFGDRLRARDCELLLQYLTVPYLRIPLVIKFFSDPVRMQVSVVVI